MKIVNIAILFVVLALTGVYAGNMQLQFGSYVARAVGTSGRFQLTCTGGSGNYQYSFSNLPAGWTVNGNIITVPNINSIQGQTFGVNAQVVDGSTGEVLNVNVDLTISGVRINVANGGAVNGTFGNLSGSTVSSGGASTTTSVVSTSSSVTSLYDSFPGLPANSAVPQATVSIPSPSGAPSLPNPAPGIIANAQAPFNRARDTRQITVSDVKRTAIFNRQINANKAVANLIAIVQRLTANVNAATNDVTVLTGILADAEAAYNACQNQVFDLANTHKFVGMK